MKKLAAVLSALALLFTCGCGNQSVVYDFSPAQDNILVVYTSHKETVYGPIIKEFEETTGIWVKTVTGGSNELLELIEAQAGQPQCDVMFGGGVESLLAYQQCFEPYLCGEADMIMPSLMPQDKSYTPFSVLPVVMIYNPKLVDPEQLFGWRDLLDQKWRGNIAMANPTVSGSGYTAAITMLSCIEGDMWTNLRQLAENLDGKALSDSGYVVDNVANGSMLIGVTLEETALRQIESGADIAIFYPNEGTSAVPDASALIKNAPHRENAERFMEFVLSREVQSRVSKELYRRSVRSDIPPLEGMADEERLGVIDYDIEAAGRIKQEFIGRWAQYDKEQGE